MNLEAEVFTLAAQLQDFIKEEYEVQGFGNKRVAYAWLRDFESGIRTSVPAHPWVFIESDEDFYSIAFTRSTSPAAGAEKPPEKLFSRSHTDHRCSLRPELNVDASVYFLRKYRLTPTNKLVPKIQLATRATEHWEKRIQLISSSNSVCIEPNQEISKMIRICANARKRS